MRDWIADLNVQRSVCRLERAVTPRGLIFFDLGVVRLSAEWRESDEFWFCVFPCLKPACGAVVRLCLHVMLGAPSWLPGADGEK